MAIPSLWEGDEPHVARVRGGRGGGHRDGPPTRGPSAPPDARRAAGEDSGEQVGRLEGAEGPATQGGGEEDEHQDKEEGAQEWGIR